MSLKPGADVSLSHHVQWLYSASGQPCACNPLDW